MDVKAILESQYRAALRMLREAVVKCPPEEWNSLRHTDRTWMRALHTLYYAHKYLQVSARGFSRWRSHSRTNGGRPMTKQEILEYIDFVEAQVPDRLRATDLGAMSGFSAYPQAGKLEMHMINIRHIQHHSAELYERIGARRRLGLRWIGHVHRKSR